MFHHLPDTETSTPDALEPLEREILVLVVDVVGDDLDELPVDLLVAERRMSILLQV